MLLVFFWSFLLPVQAPSAPSISMPFTHLLSPALLGNGALIISTNLGTNSLTTLPDQRTARVNLCCLSTLLTLRHYSSLCYCQEEIFDYAKPAKKPTIKGEFSLFRVQSLDECRADLSLHVRRMRDACTTRREAYCQSSPLALLTICDSFYVILKFIYGVGQNVRIEDLTLFF